MKNKHQKIPKKSIQLCTTFLPPLDFLKWSCPSSTFSLSSSTLWSSATQLKLSELSLENEEKTVTTEKNKQELNRNWNPWKNRKFHTQLCDINTDKIGFSDLLYWFSGSGNSRCKWTKEMSLHFKHLGEHWSKNPRFKHSSLALISNWGSNSLRNCLAQHWQLGPFKL